jgi:hypothetical protein
LGFNGLIPQHCWSFEIHLINTHPQGLLNLIHAKVFHIALVPEAWVLTVEFRKWNFRQTTSVVVWARRIRRVWMKII